MSDPAPHATTELRVHVSAADPRRRAALETIVRAHGHALVALDVADVVLSDGDSATTGAPVVALGSTDDEHRGALPLDAGASQIDAALRAVAAGLIVRAAEIDEAAFEALPERTLQPLLTPRETEVLAAIADGLSNKEIARRLDISQHTVKFHIESLLRKLGARSRAEAVAKGLARRRDEGFDL